MNISIDLETFSDVDISKGGIYRYAESDNFEILLFAYAVDGGEVVVVDMAQGEKIPENIINAIKDRNITKWAFNSQFERICLSMYFKKHRPELMQGNYLDPEGWKCSMTWCAYMGLPMSLAGAGAVLGLEQQKLTEGKELIRYFCIPCKPTKVNGGRIRNLPEHDTAKWENFVRYNKRDVEVEMAIQAKLSHFPVPENIWEEFWVDQRINDRGIEVDMEFARNAIELDKISRESLMEEVRNLTGLENPNSVIQLKEWLHGQGLEFDSLDKKAVAAILPTAPPVVQRVLRIRQKLAKSSVKKYQAMENTVCNDSRARGMFRFYGASRTGRWCLTGDHEVLTDNGWVRLDEWTGGRIACWNAASEGVSFQRAEAVCFDYDGPMYTYRDIRISQCSTPDHKMRVQRKYGSEWVDMTVKEMADILPIIPLPGRKKHKIKVKPEIVPYKGKVYCAVTSTGYFLVRREGRVWVTGNSGKSIQLQNLPQNHISDLAEARALVKAGSFEVVSMLYDDVPDTLSQLIRTAFVPRTGYKFVVADFSAIEARVLAYLAKEQWVLDTFAAGKDIYCATASKMFHCNVEKNGENGELRQKGKQATLSCGYGGSVGALIAMGALESGMEENELQPLVDAWRKANPHIVNFWWSVDGAAKEAVIGRTTTSTHGIRFIYKSGMLFIELPSGRRLAYVKPKMGENRFGGESITYEGTNGTTKKWERLETFGGKLVENCLAEGTLVLTDRGYIPIQMIKQSDLIWDGIEWVTHDGIAYQGIKTTVAVGSLHMTNNHKILTEKGWIECGKAEGFNWAEVRLPDRFRAGGEQQKWESTLEMQVRMWKRGCLCRERSKERNSLLWLQEKAIYRREEENSWNVKAPSLGCMAFNEAALHRFESSCLQKLWRAWHNCLSKMAGKFREFLGGYGTYLDQRIGFGQNRQRERIFTRELSMDNKENKLQQQKNFKDFENKVLGDSPFCSCGNDGTEANYFAVPAKPRVADRITVSETGLSESVYDIRNCGPRHRFTVLDNDKLRIVSNCTQAMARDILMFAIRNMKDYRIVAHVHDEVIVECPEDISVDSICQLMSKTPDWAEGLTLKAEGYEGRFYQK